MAQSKLTYVITGANRGIGLELARQSLAMGHDVVVGVRKPSLELKALEETSGGRLKIVELDVQSDASVQKFRDSVKAQTETVDVLINNAGVYFDDDGKADSVAIQKVVDTLNTNAVGPVRVTQALLPLLKRSSSPRVANITSQMGSIADNGSGSSLAYRMSKAALNMFVKTLSLDEKNVIALALHPGWVQTSMGGPRAPLPAEASAQGLLSLIQKAKASDSGKFYNYSGKELPW